MTIWGTHVYLKRQAFKLNIIVVSDFFQLIIITILVHLLVFSWLITTLCQALKV